MEQDKSTHNGFFSPLFRLSLVLAGIAFCLVNGWLAGRDGLGRLLTLPGQTTGMVDSAAEAVQLSPTDPEVHSVYATALLNVGQAKAAVAALEKAVSLRSRHYGLWLELGRACEVAGDNESALKALQQAVNLAPSYAQPSWQLGNLLLRMGSTEEAFAELKKAATSDSTLLPNAADLAWGAFKGDIAAIERVINPQTDNARLALAVLLAKRGKAEDAIRLFRAAQQVSKEERRLLITTLLTDNHFREGFEIWSASPPNGRLPAVRNQAATIVDGSFEQGWPTDELAFGWVRARDAHTLRISHDSYRPYSGQASVLIDWKGHSDPSQPLLHQLVVVEPNSSYQLSFIARTESVVAGGSPEVLIIDAATNGRTLAKALSLSVGTTDWRTHTLAFSTDATTQAVRIIVRRQGCSAAGPCPVFGKLWLDEFRLTD